MQPTNSVLKVENIMNSIIATFFFFPVLVELFYPKEEEKAHFFK